MIIGTVRPEEARALDTEAGEHQFHGASCGPVGRFEVFWHSGGVVEDGICEGCEVDRPGWYWSDEGEPEGPFSSSIRARADANPAWLDAQG